MKPDPVVFPAVADRVGLLPFPAAIVDFYLRISEAKSLASEIERVPKKEEVGSDINLTRQHARVLVESLYTALVIGREVAILKSSKISDFDTPAEIGRNHLTQQVDACLNSARATFPDLFPHSPR